MPTTARSILTCIAIFPIAMSLADTAKASRLDELSPGARLRVTLTQPGDRTLTGSFLDLQDSVLRVESGRPVAIPLSKISGVEQSIGRHRHTKWGFLIGLGAGLAVASILHERSDSDGLLDPGTLGGFVRLGVVLGGTAAGTLVGYNVRTDIWEDVKPPRA